VNVLEAMNNRFSARAFLPRPVSKETLQDIFKGAARTPSWANSQPWEVFLAAGEMLENLRAANIARFKSGEPRSLEVPGHQQWPPEIRERIDLNQSERLRIMSISPDDKAGRQTLSENNYRFFDAPAVAFLCADRSLLPWCLFDLGAFSMIITLAARNYDVDSIPAVMMTSYPDIIREQLDIPPELAILFAVALGYHDEKNPINRFRSARRPVDEFVHFMG
jgi:nitroreductase